MYVCIHVQLVYISVYWVYVDCIYSVHNTTQGVVVHPNASQPPRGFTRMIERSRGSGGKNSMYPTVITHRAEKQQGGKQRREEKSIEYDKLTNVTILMKLRFELGFWMRNPRMTLDDMEFMRKDVYNYFLTNPQYASAYLNLLILAEPSLKMGETLVYKAAQPKASTTTIAQPKVGCPRQKRNARWRRFLSICGPS